MVDYRTTEFTDVGRSSRKNVNLVSGRRRYQRTNRPLLSGVDLSEKHGAGYSILKISASDSVDE